MNWYYVENGQQKGPVTQDQLDELARQGTIKADSLVWTDGMANWLPYSQARPGSGAAPAAASIGGQFAPVAVEGTREQAASRVAAPAVGLMVVAGILIAFVILGAVFEGAMNNAIIKLMPEEMREQVRTQIETQSQNPIQNVIAWGTRIFAIASGAFIFWGAHQMKNLRMRGVGVAISILVMIPCFSSCCCVIGIPFGIWALVVLNKPEVKAHFS